MTDEEILLETGTNEFEFAEFIIGDTHFGINIAKVKEFIKEPPVVQVPDAHQSVDGVFNLRGNIIVLINLERHLKLQNPNLLNSNSEEEPSAKKIAIITEFNNRVTGFLVHSIEGIQRLSWNNLVPMSNVTASGNQNIVGSARIKDRIILILDFEKILAEIMPETAMKEEQITASADLSEKRSKYKIVLAEDSSTIRKFLIKSLKDSGYNVKGFENGLLLFQYLEKNLAATDDVSNFVDLIISDIEMPQMDGHHLIKRIRENPRLTDLPVIIFSSITNEMIRERGKGIGADGQIPKPEINMVVAHCDKFLGIISEEEFNELLVKEGKK